MFTGLIRELARVNTFKNSILSLKSSYKPNIGDSIAINGACTTVIYVDSFCFKVEFSKESRNILALENYSELVHMEPSMQLNDKVEGHLVQGHIDCLGTISEIKKLENSWDFYINISQKFIKYMMPKGSIAIDGISLTINEIKKDNIRITIINHTMNLTLFKKYKVGRRMNIETDMFARYIYSILNKNKKLGWSDVDLLHASF